jgi:ferrochelatase
MTTGVLVMAYGTPRDRDEIEAYYTDIRRGRAPDAEQLADLTRRYDAIGGTFPLRAITDAQVVAITTALETIAPGAFVTATGMKHSAPRIEDGVQALLDQEVQRIVGLVLAPHFSALSVGDYASRAAAASAGSDVPVTTVESWHLLPAYVSFLADAVVAALGTVPAGSRVVFTAHSLPQRILATGDPYPEQLRETAAAVAAQAGLAEWSVGWQSAGRTPEPWLGPDVLDLVRESAAGGAVGLVVCACGFVADHLEVAYDLDIEAAGLAAELGLPFTRCRSVGADPEVMAALAALAASC